jgi:lysine 2,3-aminomutase
MQTAITSLPELQEYLAIRYPQHSNLLTDSETNGSRGFPIRIPQHYADLIDWQNPQDPLRIMVLPTIAEENIDINELSDPIGDEAHEAVPGLIHRYPDRCLLLLTSHCRVHCRFCFRREVVGKVRPVNFAGIRDYLAAHPEIHEVIFSGGDPGTFPPAFLDNIRRQLAGLSHITRWRFHTRVPAVDPEYITDEWLYVAEQFVGKKIVVIHINHPRELSEKVQKLVTALLNRNFLVLSQSVLLKTVNADVETLTQLFTKLVAAGVKPYYLHHLDLAKGTSHFRTSIEVGIQLFRQLRGNLSSVCMPEYVLDLPGGFGKVPVLWLEKMGEREYKAKTFEGKEVVYQDQAQKS